jgi:multidrug efflux system membrane fusion protein
MFGQIMTTVSSSSSTKLIFISLFLLAAAGAAYFVVANSSTGEGAGAAMMPPPPEVDVMIVEPTATRTWSRFSGKLAAVDFVEIKPLVAGRIEKVFFDEGELVLKGDPLFLIDPRPFQAIVNRTEAQLISARSTHKLAKQELERTKGLIERRLISQSLFDQSKRDYEVAVAVISEVKNALIEARLNLEYATISAPFDGRISRAELTQGNIVEVSTGAPVLAVLVSEGTIYAEFNIDERRYIKVMRSTTELGEMPVVLNLAGEDDVVYEGYLHSLDNQLDSSTGTIRARALFENTDGILKPGMYANIRLGSAKERMALMIPQAAIGTNQSKKFVYVVGSDNTVAYREVVLGEQLDAYREVESGIESGEQVVTNGIAKIRPGMPVNISQPSTHNPH